MDVTSAGSARNPGTMGAAAQEDPEPRFSEAEFTREVRALVTDTAPRLFAVVQEYGERVDGRVAAWGMAFEDGHAEVVAAEGHVLMSLRSPERAVWRFGRRPEVTARLVWVTDGRQAEGQKQGRAEGRAESRAEGQTEGPAESRAEGQAQGQAEGAAGAVP